MTRKNTAPAKVTNINKNGELFNPAEYTVRRADAPGLYAFLDQVVPVRKKENRNG